MQTQYNHLFTRIMSSLPQEEIQEFLTMFHRFKPRISQMIVIQVSNLFLDMHSITGRPPPHFIPTLDHLIRCLDQSQMNTAAQRIKSLSAEDQRKVLDYYLFSRVTIQGQEQGLLLRRLIFPDECEAIGVVKKTLTKQDISELEEYRKRGINESLLKHHKASMKKDSRMSLIKMQHMDSHEGNQSLSLCRVDGDLTHEFNLTIPFSVPVLIREIAGKGRGMVAWRDIRKGEVVIPAHKPIASVLCQECINTHCHHCRSPFKARKITCKGCGFALYCSEQCRTAGSRIHQHECRYLARLQSPSASKEEAVIHALYKAGKHGLSVLDSARLTLRLVTLMAEVPSGQLLPHERADLLQSLSGPATTGSVSSMHAFGAMYQKMLRTGQWLGGIVPANAFSFRHGTLRSMDIHGYSSLINHDCTGDLTVRFIASGMQMVATHDIPRGEEITFNYINSDDSGCGINQEYSVRNKRFVFNWGFECHCPACQVYERWAANPVFGAAMTPEQRAEALKYPCSRCKACGGPATPVDAEEKRMMCLDCGKTEFNPIISKSMEVSPHIIDSSRTLPPLTSFLAMAWLHPACVYGQHYAISAVSPLSRFLMGLPGGEAVKKRMGRVCYQDLVELRRKAHLRGIKNHELKQLMKKHRSLRRLYKY
eukprot:gnl/Dysnectes_brevis/6822_a10863_190.p1 GENE.gnl/Dysnectes_brevis/6822_a10863_190~~gnl/Dysnectes_brevis/6822_a10863_190.p1  ORF type:complete len:651 (-),score=156.21 gnl/Dysnectes_brevis/6822_a10863_190:15-1967(-)